MGKTGKKMEKKNGFMLFVEDRMKQGQNIPKAELVRLVSQDWEALPSEQKENYKQRAKEYNEQLRARKEAMGLQPSSGSAAQAGRVTDPEVLTAQEKKAMIYARGIVEEIFANPDWVKEVIVICTMNMYIEPSDDIADGDFPHIPAEVALVSMTLKEGVIDNWARVIHPLTLLVEYESVMKETMKKLHLPAWEEEEFARLRSFMEICIEFLTKNTMTLKGKEGEYFLFAFDSDYKRVRRCFDWLLEKTEWSIMITILSLDQYAFLASSPLHAIKKIQTGPSNAPVVSKYRIPGLPLVPHFVYPNPTFYPMIKYGVFEAEIQVDAVIKCMSNFRYFEELSCVYHIKVGEGIHHCAMTHANRYAFCLLEVLTLSNEVQPIAGGHYPEVVSNPLNEKARRFKLITMWGITDYEENMQEYSPPGLKRRSEAEEAENEEGPLVIRDGIGQPNPFPGEVPSLFTGPVRPRKT